MSDGIPRLAPAAERFPASFMDSNEQQRRRELDLRREQEKKDLETESTIGQRPLEGFSGAHTTWTGDQDEQRAPEEHGDDERASRRLSESQIPPKK